ncbi:type III pantothenate kinase [Rubrimonas cliftonensis]|uniref:Type III pantothenate kinase n=1 Tax=Rubrimonas cliftonensis TaxID=89524 RepID=A0A1H3ZCI7_9RHOB|nr:type III pantothenate kinase [Rubrimonas cliftonensis]SEA21350.1 type III pantothenate kinase [Rubrimonas cliftonensis]
MLLAIDVGNTNTVFALHDGEAFVAEWRCKTDAGRTADEYFVWLRQLMDFQNIGVRAVRSAICGSVAPKTVFNIKKLCETYFSCTPLFVSGSETRLPVEVRVDAPHEVGADRIVNTVGAYTAYGPNLIVVDFGTATTFDVVAEDGAYVGGVIAPGVNLSLEALHRAAARLPNIDVARPETVVGRDTLSCMRSGAYWGYVSLIEGVCARIAQERGVSHDVIATGGLSALFAKSTDTIRRVDPDLTMRGLVEIHRFNAAKG